MCVITRKITGTVFSYLALISNNYYSSLNNLEVLNTRRTLKTFLFQSNENDTKPSQELY